MKVYDKKYRNKCPFQLLILLLVATLLPDCSIIQNISKKQPTSAVTHPTIKTDFSDSIEALSFKARITIQSLMGDMTISAEISYSGMDTLIIRAKDPLKRQLATIRIINDEYFIWLQRENRRLSGTEMPANINDYPIPQLPLGDIAGLMIGQIRSVDEYYSISFDEKKRVSKISDKPDTHWTIAYHDWTTTQTHYPLPTIIRLTGDDNLKIEIQYSQFQLKIRKLS